MENDERTIENAPESFQERLENLCKRGIVLPDRTVNPRVGQAFTIVAILKAEERRRDEAELVRDVIQSQR